MTLDEAERQAHEMLNFLRQEYERQAAPYIKIISDIHNVRPFAVYVPMENWLMAEMLPFTEPQDTNTTQPADNTHP